MAPTRPPEVAARPAYCDDCDKAHDYECGAQIQRRYADPAKRARALLILEEFAERAARGVDYAENIAFSVSRGGPTAPPPSGVQRRYQGAEAPWAKLAPSDVSELRTSDEPTRAAARRLGVSPKTVRSARRGVTYVTEPTRPRCPSCGAEWNMPNMPKVTGCLPTCRLYGRRLPETPAPPFRAAPLIGHLPRQNGPTTADVHARMQALEALWRACDAWAQHREAASGGLTSQLSIQISEGFIEDAVRRLRALRKGER